MERFAQFEIQNWRSEIETRGVGGIEILQSHRFEPIVHFFEVEIDGAEFL
jgi:hypothetical protein